MVTGETEDMKSFIYVKIRFIGVLFLLTKTSHTKTGLRTLKIQYFS